MTCSQPSVFGRVRFSDLRLYVPVPSVYFDVRPERELAPKTYSLEAPGRSFSAFRSPVSQFFLVDPEPDREDQRVW